MVLQENAIIVAIAIFFGRIARFLIVVPRVVSVIVLPPVFLAIAVIPLVL
jgi:hypothetical protein